MVIKELEESDVIAVHNISNCINAKEAAEYFLHFVLGFRIVKIHIARQCPISNETW